MYIAVMATFFQKHQAYHHTPNHKGTIVLFSFIVVQQEFCSFEKKRGLPQKFVHVLYCPIKISILFNGLCVWIMFSFIGIEFAYD